MIHTHPRARSEVCKQVRELQRVLGKKTMEVEILREAVNLMSEKTPISRLPSPPADDSR